MTEKIYGGIEGGGINFNCAIGNSPENIIAEARFPTTTPAETIGQAIEFFLPYANQINGIGLGGLVLLGDVIMTEVVDEDEVKTGHQRAGMYFDMSGFLITLSGLLVSSVFGLLMPALGYDTLLDVQPASVDLGFRIFLTVPTSIGFLLAIFLLWLYPLHGDYLKHIRDRLSKKQESSNE